MIVSVIIPVYSVEKYIARCLDSIINQSYNNIEIIVVNDATPDNSMTIVKAYAEKDSRIHIINNHRNMGTMITRQNGYIVANGEYLTFVDPDDYLPRNAIEALVNKISEEECDIVIGTLCYQKKEDTINIENHLSYGNNKTSVYKSLLVGELTHSLCGRLFKKSLFDYKYQRFDGMNNSEDKCLFYQIVKKIKKVQVINNIVYYYVENPFSSSKNRIPISQIENMIIANSICYSLCADEDRLEEIADYAMTKDLIYFYKYGYSHGQIRKLVKKHNMEKFFSIRHAFCVLSCKEILYFLIHKTLFHMGVKRYRHGF